MADISDCNESCGDFKPSQLGTKQYWDNAYEKEIENFLENDDAGEIWFGEESMARITRWIEGCEEINKNMSVIDLGCGNGAMLMEMAEMGFVNLVGVDFSENAISLARSVAKKENLSIKYEVIDILEPVKEDTAKYDLCIDKGTYDAISLNPEDAKTCRHKYIDNLKRMLHNSGFFIITSCNWTAEEIVKHFINGFVKYCVLQTPKFQFGGKSGNSVSCVVFKKTLP